MRMKDAWQLSRIAKTYRFEAAHRLPLVPESHKCHRLHGHNYVAEIEVRGEIAPKDGFCGNLDFFELDKLMEPILEVLDHRYLNDVPGLENPTAELIADWILKKINANRAIVFSVKVWETPDCWAQVINKGGWFSAEHRD